MLNIGMVGCGNISPIYLKNITGTFKEINLVAVCDLIRERAEKAQAEYNVPKLYDTMEEMFEDKEIDIILNITRPYQHFEVSKKALLAGKHVYCEKPLGITLEEGEELVALAKEKGLYLGGAPDTFMGAAIQTSRKLIDGGLIGDIVGIRLCMAGGGVETWHPDPDFFYQPGGGPMLDMGPYYITAAINLIGGIKSVYGYANIPIKEKTITSEPHKGTLIKVNTPTHIEAILHFECGVSGSIITSFEMWSRTKQTNIEVYGTKGTLVVPDPNCFNGKIIHIGNNRVETEYPIEFDYAENSRAIGLADMAKAIETGRPGRTTYKQTLHVLEVMTGVLTSAKTGMPVEIKSKFQREAPMDAALEHGIL